MWVAHIAAGVCLCVRAVYHYRNPDRAREAIALFVLLSLEGAMSQAATSNFIQVQDPGDDVPVPLRASPPHAAEVSYPPLALLVVLCNQLL